MSRKKLQQIEKLDGQTSIQQQVSAKMKQQRSLLDVMYEESLQDEKARRRSLAFYIGYLAYGLKVSSWPHDIDTDHWIKDKESFLKGCQGHPEWIHPEQIEQLIKSVGNPQNFSGAHTPSECWFEVYPKCELPDLTKLTPEPDPEPVIQPKHRFINVPTTAAPGM